MSEPIISVQNGVEVVLEGEALEQFNQQQKSIIEQLQTAKAEANAKATARESALAKLAALGLTADEVAAL
jgi:DNA-binding NarL/FixJ family response regulator